MDYEQCPHLICRICKHRITVPASDVDVEMGMYEDEDVCLKKIPCKEFEPQESVDQEQPK